MIDDVQSNWNKIEEILITVTDKLAPICEFTDIFKCGKNK